MVHMYVKALLHSKINILWFVQRYDNIMQNEIRGDEGLETWIQKWKDETVMLENKIVIQQQQIQQLESKNGLFEELQGMHISSY